MFIAETAVYFEINSDGTMGRPILDDEGVECINECMSEYPPDIEVGCRRCHYSFSVREHENGDDGFEIDDVIDDVIDERRKPCF
ncbi:hypothetical protein ACTNDZ_14505 [Selenomonas montiformis]|uniref:hypothetical protein n=1 Tax=Selenomonas montiformis TaxID=2652285 RepID=UPI003F89356F